VSDHDDLVAAGLYDPEAPDAPARLELLEYLLEEVGASIPEIVQAEEEDRLLSMAAFRGFRPAGERCTLAEVAGRAGLDLGFAQRVWRAAGFREPRPHERRFGVADTALFELVRLGRDLVGEAATLQYVRTLGEATAQIAESEVAMLRSKMEAPLVEHRRWADIARSYAEVVGTLLPRVVEAFDVLHRHHLDAVGRRYVGSTPNATNIVTLAVGFADLTGFTGLSARLDPVGLDGMLTEFEVVTGDLIAGSGAHVVKRMGDAVMFVANAPGVACTIALELVDGCARAKLPKLRVGLAFGDVVVRRGDFFGPTVNLASRLVMSAEPGVVFTDRALASRLSRVVLGCVFLPAGHLSLAGFDTPVEAFQLLRA
jgi:adenylate cyclase